MIIWRSVGVQALAEALSIWANRQSGRSGAPPRDPVTAPAPAADIDRGRTRPRSELKLVYNVDRSGG